MYLNIEDKNTRNLLLEKISVLFGISFWIIGFIFTLVYLIQSQYIFKNGSSGKEYENPGEPNTFTIYNSNKVYIWDEERAFASWTSDIHKENRVYECLYYDEKNEDSFYTKYNELKNKQNYYDKNLYLYSLISNSSINQCNCNSDTCIPEIEYKYHNINIKDLRQRYGICNNIVYNNDEINRQKTNKNIYDRWQTTFIFSYFIIILYFFLVLFWFLILWNNAK